MIGSRAGDPGPPDFVMGNTRLRARLGGLLSPAQLAALGALEGDEVLTWLRGTPYGRHLPDGDPGDAVLVAAERRQRELTGAAVAAYAGRARAVVTALVCPFDAADLVTLVRSAARGTPADAVRPLLHGVGLLSGASLTELVSTDPGARVARLAALPELDDATRRTLLDSAERFERSGDLAAWEAQVAVAVWAAADGTVRQAGRAARPARQHLAARRDAVNVVTALRLAAAQEGGEPADVAFLPPGQVDVDGLERIAGGVDPDGVVPAGWRSAVRRHRDVGDLAGLARELEARCNAEARRLLRAGDPLGAAIPVGYLARVEHEVAQVRLTASAAGAAESAVAA